METSKILSADLLDLVFDQRNKDYGAYHLRRTYHRRITKALVFTLSLAGLVLTGSVLASNMKPHQEKYDIIPGVVIEDIPLDDPEPLPEPEPQPPQEEPARTEQYINLEVVPDIQVVKPLPTQEDLGDSQIGDQDFDGPTDDQIEGPVKPPGSNEGIIDIKQRESDIWSGPVEVEAAFDGNWTKFLLNNLRGDVPVENNAPPGRHTVIVQFVVDVDGTVSDIKPLTNIGYGMEEEAVRVIKKSKKWVPAFQNTKHVKAYRIQKVTFEVLGQEE